MPSPQREQIQHSIVNFVLLQIVVQVRSHFNLNLSRLQIDGSKNGRILDVSDGMNSKREVSQMYNSLRWSLVGHLELEAHLRPLSLAGQFRIGTSEANIAQQQKRLQSVVMILGALLVLPGALALLFGLLKYPFGFAYLYDVAFASSTFILLATASLFLGTPLALLLNFLVILHLSFARQPAGLSTSVTLEPTLWHLLVLGVAFLVAAAFFGHLVADGLACLGGVKSAC